MSKDQETTVNNKPWEPAHHLLKKAVTDANKLAGSDNFREVYDGRRVASLSGNTTDALGALAQGSGLVNPAASTLTDLMSEGNMYRDFDTIKSTVADDVKAALGSTFSGGSINSGLAGDTYTRALTEALAGAEFGAYNDAQNRRLSAAGYAPSIAGMAIDEEKAALAGGLVRDDYNQRKIDAKMDKFYEKRDSDLRALKEYAGIAMGIGGMGGTGSQNAEIPFTSWVGDLMTAGGKAASGIGAWMGG